MSLPHTPSGNAVACGQERTLRWWRGSFLDSGQIVAGAGMLLGGEEIVGEGARFLPDLLATGVALYATMAIGTRRS